MKKASTYIWLFVIIILAVGSCKKNGDTPPDPPGPEPEYCYEKVYFDSIPVSNSPIQLHAFIEDNDFNIVYIWTTSFSGGTNFNVTKVDSNLNHIWTNEFQGDWESIHGITYDNSNNYYISYHKGGCVKHSDGELYFWIYMQNTLFWNHCSPHYEFITGYRVPEYTDDAETVAYKISTDGVLLWTNTFEFAARKGRNMVVSDDGQLFIGTYQVPCQNKALVYRDGIFQDTINLIDSITVILHNLSPSGSSNWEREFKIPTLYYPEWYSETPEVSLDISIDEQFVYMAISNTVYTYDYDGQLLAQYQIGNECQHVFINSCKIKNAEGIAIFQYNTTSPGSQHVRYVGRFNLNGEIDWLEEIWADEIVETKDGGFLTYDVGFNSDLWVSKYDNAGDLLWRSFYRRNHYSSLQAICTGGFLLLAYYDPHDPNNIIVIRTDANGDY